MHPTVSAVRAVRAGVRSMCRWRRGWKKPERSLNENKSNKRNQIYSYEFDDSYIYSAFLQQYTIDLQEIKYMHWWKFKALFDGLSEDTQIVKVMQYRSVNLAQIKDTERRNFYKKMKKLYALPDMRTQEEKEREFAEKFL